MKCLMMLYILMALFVQSVLAQPVSIPPTKSIRVHGKIKSPVSIRDIDLKKYSVTKIGDLQITDEKGEVIKDLKELEGVLLKDVLGGVELDTDNPRLLSEFYFVCRSIDGYKALFSYDEIFNRNDGGKVFIIVSNNDNAMVSSNESLLIISVDDVNKSRRYIKNVEAIFVGRAK